MQDTIFTKIIRGEIPSHKVYEDDSTFAFLDIHPVQPGHTLVIPKKQVEFVWELDDEDYARLMESVRKVARRLKEQLGTTYVGIKVVGIDVPHAHVHVIPFSTAGEFRNRPDATAEPDHQALAAIAHQISF